MKYIITFIGLLSVHLINAQVHTEVEGGIKIGSTSLLDEGIIRFTGSDFEGRANGIWQSLTNSNAGLGLWSQNATGDLYNSNFKKVGIGLNNPSESLHIHSNINHSTLKLSTNSNTSLSGIVLENLGQSSPLYTYLILDQLGPNYGGATGGDGTPLVGSSRVMGGVGTSKLLVGTLGDAPMHLMTNGATRIYAENSTGNIGIGNINPTSKLDVSLTSGNVSIYENVGNPHFLGLSVNSPAQFGARGHLRFLTDGALQSQIYTYYNDNLSSATLNVRTFSPDSDINFQPNSLTKVTIDGNNGFLGLGTTEPTQMLHLANSGRILMEHSNTKTQISSYKSGAAGGIIFQIDPMPENSTAASTIRFFRSVNSTGNQALQIFKGNNTTQWNHLLSSKSDSYLSRLSGKVIIGGTPPTPGNYKLYVDGGILAEEVKVALSNASDWADDAFEKTPEIDDVESSIKDKSHLKDMPSADFLVENGYNLREMDANLLQQVEWLWMHEMVLKNRT